MNSRERLTRCYYNRELDRPAVFNRTGYPSNDPTYDRLKAYIAMHGDLKRYWHWWGYETSCCQYVEDIKNFPETYYSCERYTEPYTEDFERIITILHTPGGDLSSSFLRSLRGQPGLEEAHFIKNREDAEKYLSLPIPEFRKDVSSFFGFDREIGERGIVDVWLGFNPAGYVVDLLGQENFAVMSITDRDIIHALCKRQMDIILNSAKYLLAQSIGPFFSLCGEEYLVPPMHGPSDFLEFNAKYDKPIIDLIHDAGGRMHVHCHGAVKKVLKGFAGMGVDVLHPFEAPPMGDITPSEAKEMVRGKMCLEGNLQISHMYERTPGQIREETENLIREVFDDHKGLIVCPTASPYIPGKGGECFQQYKAMIDTVLAQK